MLQSSRFSSKSLILFILSLAQFLGLSLWFVPNAILDQLVPIFDLTDTEISWISIAVILGFVSGSILSAVFNLSDIISGSKLFFIAAGLGAISNQSLVFVHNLESIILLRFLTGMFLAGIYPVGMKLVSSHFKTNRGLAMGILLSALTLGSGLPYLFNLFGEPNWKIIITLVTTLALVAALLVLLFISEGPYLKKSGGFSLSAVKTIYQSKAVRLANYGYFGHMWELYTFWVWIPVMISESYSYSNPLASSSEILYFTSLCSFLVFAFGSLANILGGYFADQIGRTLFNILVLSVSGLSSLIIGLFFDRVILLVIIAIIWGIAIIPDSPQYSSMVTELSDQTLVGSALTMQTAIGFALTMISIHLLPLLRSLLGWRFVFVYLSVGPLLGIVALIKLRNLPESKLIAAGKK